MMISNISPSNMQASAAVFNVEAVAKVPLKAHDDVVAPIDTSGDDTAGADLPPFNMKQPNLGHNLDLKV